MHSRIDRAVLSAISGLALLAWTSCARSGAGEPCHRSGDGFLARHNCQTFCLAFPIRCGDGTTVTPNVCAGRQDCRPGSCPPEEVCVHVNIDRTFCVPDTICPSWPREELTGGPRYPP